MSMTGPNHSAIASKYATVVDVHGSYETLCLAAMLLSTIQQTNLKAMMLKRNPTNTIDSTQPFLGEFP